MDSASHLRTVLLSTIFTLFITLYCCIRPDFPSHHDSRLRILLTKLNIIFWMLICPEAVFYWAMRQWFEAGNVAVELQDHDWTRRHGLFFLMGGFMLCNRNGQPVKTLSFPHFERLLYQKSIDPPPLTSSHIQEQSHLHPVLVLVAFLQGIWFITQCLSRINITLTDSGLRVITPLEAMTATLVIVNWIIFFFAWKKPLDVRFPILIKPTLNSSTTANRNQTQTGRIPIEDAFTREENFAGCQTSKSKFQLEHPPPQLTLISKAINKLNRSPNLLVSTLLWPLRSIYNDLTRLVPPDYFEAPDFPDGTLKIPLFYVQNTMIQRVFLLPAAILSLVVSTISLLFVTRSNSSLHFTPQQTQVAWRITSIAATSFSALILGFVILTNSFRLLAHFLDYRFAYMTRLKKLSDLFMFILLCVLSIGVVPFLLARVVLLLLSVSSLRFIPPEAFVTRPWTDYIPHFS